MDNYTASAKLTTEINTCCDLLKVFSKLSCHLTLSSNRYFDLVAREFNFGNLHFPISILKDMQYDLQIYNGRIYTKWGYGVPLIMWIGGWARGIANFSFHYTPVSGYLLLWILSVPSIAYCSNFLARYDATKDRKQNFSFILASTILVWAIYVSCVLNVAAHRNQHYEQVLVFMSLFLMPAILCNVV